jgi:DnaK suppressor protein
VVSNSPSLGRNESDTFPRESLSSEAPESSQAKARIYTPMSSTTASVIYAGDDFLLRQRGELNARRLSYREQRDRLSAAADEWADAGEAPDLGDDQGFAEADSSSVERDRLLSLQAIARQRIEDIDAAVRRVEAGAYGACRTCRQPIPVARLEAVPEATQCVGCASGSVLRQR